MDCSSSQTPLIMHHQPHQPSWPTNITQPLYTTRDNRRFHLPSPPPSLSPNPPDHGLFKRVVDGLHLACASSSTSCTGQVQGFQSVQPGSDRFNMTPKEIADAKAIAASKSHSEAEKRRRERINNHLTKLRSLLPNTTKTDKASLLAEVIEHVKELKTQTSIISERVPLPSETDELTVVNSSDEEGRIVIRASLCCEDRSDLLHDLIKTLKVFRLRTLKAEITTLGRRVRNVLFVTGEDRHSSGDGDDNQEMVNRWISTIEEALRAIIEKRNEHGDSTFAGIKRQKNK